MFAFQFISSWIWGAPGSKQEASTPITEEKENSFPVFDGDNTIEEQTSIVNESYENSSSWESYEVSSSQEAIEAEKYLDQNTPNSQNESTTTADESGDKYLAIARLDDELENEKWEERTAVITSNDHQEYIACAASILQDVLAEVKTPVKPDRAARANVCGSDSDATHDLPTQQHTPTNLENKFSESTTTITTNTTGEQHSENLVDPMQQRTTTSEDEEDLSDSRQTGVSSADNSFASAARGLGECEPITTCAAQRC